MSRTVVRDAPAKVNLTLEVLGPRGDGYHDLASVFATVDLRDRVRVAPSRALDVRIAPDVGAAPGDDLASRAVRALAERSGRAPAAYVRIAKRIPVAAGLGGGSSDAAAVLHALASAWRLSDDGLAAVGATIGSDVPFFVSGAAYALVTGRGEHVAALPAPSTPLWIVLVRIPVRVSTAAVYAARRSGERSDGARTASLADALRRGAVAPTTVREHLGNDLAAAAERVAPGIAAACEAARSAGVPLVLSGSGPTLFAVANDRGDALRRARILKRKGLRARAYLLGVTARSSATDRGLSPYV